MKKTMIRSTVILILAFFMRTLIACCNCANPVITHYSHQSIEALNLDNTGAKPNLSTTQTIPKEAYGLRLIFFLEQLAVIPSSTSSLFTPALAQECFCAPAVTVHASDSILSIHVISNNDFNDALPAGSDVTSYFKILEVDHYVTLADFVYYHPATLYEALPNFSIDLFLLTLPPTGVHKFTITVYLSDGRLMQVTADPVDLI